MMTIAPNVAVGLPGPAGVLACPHGQQHQHAAVATAAALGAGGGAGAFGAPAAGASLIGGGGSTIAPALLGATAIGPAPVAAATAPATGTIDTSQIFGFDPSIPLAPGALAGPITLPTPLTAPASITAAPLLAGAAGAPAAAIAAERPLTTVAPGGNAQDAALVERALGVLRQSQSGAQVVDRLLAVGARINVISDQEFASMGHGSAHAFYDPKIDTMFLRRSDLADDSNVKFAALALAHEGTHLLDDVSGIAAPVLQEITNRVAAAGGLGTAAGAEAREQGLFELTMIKEARAFLFAGSVARELGVQRPASDPTSVAIAGGNDQATYEAVWQRLLSSSYNEQGRTAAPRNL